ncbi:MAG: deoxyribose-phosphate aldolase [Oligoflexia bacterium]|nr:deoxyribose-phosphate aldolase [Oligoflexia bacterium]
MEHPVENIAATIDHTLLEPDATKEQVSQFIDEAIKYGFAGVCVYADFLKFTSEKLKSTGVKAITVIDFPFGQGDVALKVRQTREAIDSGAQEIDMVMNYLALKAGDSKRVFDEIRAVVNEAKHTPVKVILETSELTHEQIVNASQIVKTAGAAFVKTSTGFSKSGATAEVVQLIRRTVGPQMGVKASGGIRSYQDAIKMLAAGANRLGTSSGVSIVTHQASAQGGY